MPPSICDPKPGETALDALTGIANVVTTIMNMAQPPDPLAIVYVADHSNYAVHWTPKRPEPPGYWPSYGDAIAALTARELSAAKRRILAMILMDEYFVLGTYSLPKTKGDAQNAFQNLRNQSDAMDRLSSQVIANKIDFFAYCGSASGIANELSGISGFLLGLDQSMREISCIEECITYCREVSHLNATLPTTIAGARAAQIKSFIWGRLTIVRRALKSIMVGYATVTNNESIPGFFLMRLLVGYRIGTARPDDKLYAGIASAQLTTLLYRQQDWLFDLMQGMIVDLAKALGALGPDVCFFLKGGRGITYLLGDPKTGENDWDTQILINPLLPWNEWWQCHDDVRSVVNNQLMRFNFVFSANLMSHSAALIASTQAVTAAAAKDPGASSQIMDDVFTLAWQSTLDEQSMVDDPAFVMEAVWQEGMQKPNNNCKAELIDVGLPRFYTVELLEQWHHVRDSVTVGANNVPYPEASYFIEELIAMIRENDAGMSPSPVKRAKRLRRLLSLLSSGVTGFNDFLKHQQTLAIDSNLSRAMQKVDGIREGQISALITILLGQFCTAYQLIADPNLAAAFDTFASKLLSEQIDNAGSASIDQQADSIFVWCQIVSRTMMKHLAERGQFVLDQTAAIARLLGETASAKNPTISAVVEGSFAICLYQQQFRPLITNGVAPTEFAVVRLSFQNCASTEQITPEMFQAVVTNIQAYVASSQSFGALSATTHKNRIQVFAKQSIPLAAESYQPLMIEFKVRAATNLVTQTAPKMTLLGLQPLTSWCRGRAAKVTEWAMRQKLNETFGALIEIEAAAWASSSWKTAANL